MMLMAAALAPSFPRNGPLMLAPPSYVMSPKRLTTPRISTNRKAFEAASGFAVLRFIDSVPIASGFIEGKSDHQWTISRMLGYGLETIEQIISLKTSDYFEM